MKTAKTMKRLLCLVLTLCITLSCAAITVSANDEPVQDPEISALPIICSSAVVQESDGYKVTQMSLNISIDSEDDELFFWDVFDATDKDARLTITCSILDTPDVPLAVGYAVPAFDTYTDETGATVEYPMTMYFDLYAADGTPGITMASLKAINKEALNALSSRRFDLDLFSIRIEFPEGLFSGERFFSAAGAFNLETVYGLYEYGQHILPDWAITGVTTAVLMLFEQSKAFPKTFRFFETILSKTLSKIDSDRITTLISNGLKKIGEAFIDVSSHETGRVIKGLFSLSPVIVFIIPLFVRLFNVINHYLRDVYGTSIIGLFKANM